MRKESENKELSQIKTKELIENLHYYEHLHLSGKSVFGTNLNFKTEINRFFFFCFFFFCSLAPQQHSIGVLVILVKTGSYWGGETIENE